MEAVTNLSWTSVLVGGVVGLVVYWQIQKKRYRKPPGPCALPLIVLSDKNLHITCMKMAEKYGPTIKLQLGPFEIIMLNNIEVVTEALITKGTDFANRPVTTTIRDLTEGCNDIVFAPYSETWKLHRKIVSKALRNYLQGSQLQEGIDASVTRVVEVLEQQTKAFDPTEYCDFIICNILSYLCYGHVYTFDDPEFKRIMRLENDVIESLGFGTLEDIFPFMKKIYPSKKYTQIMSMNGQLVDIIKRKVKEHQDTFNPDKIRDLTDSLLLARAEAEKEDDASLLEKLTDVHLRQTVSDVFFAGMDTSRITLNWAFLFMAAYQDIQEKCQQELDTVIGRDSAVRLGDKKRLPYTDACLMEIMRLGMAVPMGVPHSALCDSKIAGYDIPKGTMVMVNHYALHMDPRHWKNPTKFDPTRYLDDQGKMNQKPDSWLPFSAGRRVCLGESVAKPELFTIFASLIQHFNISLPSGVEPVFETKGGAASPAPMPYKIIVTKRE